MPVRGRMPRMTIPTQLVLRLLLEDPAQELYGVQIGDGAGLPSGTVHPILARWKAWAGSIRAGKRLIRAWRAARPAGTTGSPRTVSTLRGRHWPALIRPPAGAGSGRP
jgi:hypothetical protein